MLFGQDDNNKPSVKKILLYCVVITAVLLALGFVGERLGWTSPY